MAAIKDATADLNKVFGTMNLNETFTGDEFKARPAAGTKGKPVNVYANMYPMHIKPGQTIWHYDVDIKPVVKVTDNKYPRHLLQKIWLQAGREASGTTKAAFDAMAFDLVRNAWGTIQFPLSAQGTCEIIIGLVEDGKAPDNDKRRFKIVIRPAIEGRKGKDEHVIDLDSVTDFCKGTRLNEQAQEKMIVATQALNVLLRQDVSLQYKPVGAQGRRFFGAQEPELLPEGGVCHSGFMQSVRFTQSGHPAVQLDTAYSAFVRPGPLVDVIADILRLGGGGGFRGGRGGPRGGFARGGGPMHGGGGSGVQELNTAQVVKLNGILFNAKFTVSHRKTSEVFSIRKITQQPVAQMKFLLDGKNGQESRMVSLSDYFKQTYNVQVTKPRLPCVSYGKKNYIPLEFVVLKEFNSIPFLKLSGDQTAAMIKVAAKRPDERRNKINHWRQKLDWSSLPKVQSWNLKIEPNMMQVRARTLQPPIISYAGGKTQQPMGGQWNMRGTKYAKAGKPLKSWAIVNLDGRCERGVIQNFISKLVHNLSITNCPVELTRPPIVDGDQGRRFDANSQGWSCIKPALTAGAREAYMATKTNPQLLIVILPGKDLGRYQEIKRIAMQELKMPVVTQLLQYQKISDARGQEQYIGNVSMKVHAKLGGVTHHVPIPSILDKTTMMIGADVTHPPPKFNGPIAPSIAVTVASISGDNFLFRPEIRLQQGRKESITDLQAMVRGHLTLFRQNTGALPAKIIMFRDGVSEGQFAMCATEEYDSILKAAREMDPKYRPKTTFVVCAKRHSMRFFATQPQDADRTGNLQPAHSGLQGTARPTHYIVVKDDIGFDADKMQGLCNALCYSYARACRSVSLIPVAYYCDIIAGKWRDFVYDDVSDTASTISGSRDAGTAEHNPMALMKRIESNPLFNSVAWYM